MFDFVETRGWPLVDLHMPEIVPDDQATDYVAAYAALFAHGEPFVLLMDGNEVPNHSPTFMTTYLEWVEANRALQQQWCAGAVRIEPDPAVRQRIDDKTRAWRAAGKALYPTATAPDRAAAVAQGLAWLREHRARHGAETSGVSISVARDHANARG